MSAAPLRYLPNGAIDWGHMWESFCLLAQDGGPPHRGSLLSAQEGADTTSPCAGRLVHPGTFELS